MKKMKIVTNPGVSCAPVYIGLVGLAVGALMAGNTSECRTFIQNTGETIALFSVLMSGYWLGKAFNIYSEEQ